MDILSSWIKSLGLALFALIVAFSAATDALAQDVTYVGQMTLNWTVDTYSCPTGEFCLNQPLVETTASGSYLGPISTVYESCAFSIVGGGPTIPINFDGLDIVLVVPNGTAGTSACPDDFYPAGFDGFEYLGDIATSVGSFPVEPPNAPTFVPGRGQWDIVSWDPTNTYPTRLTFNSTWGNVVCDDDEDPECLGGITYADNSWSFNGELAACSVTYTGTVNGNLTRSGGLTCIIDGTVTGNVTQNGGSLFASDATIEGSLQMTGGSSFLIESTAVNGNLQIQNIPASSAQSEICGTDVKGNLQITNNGTSAAIGTASSFCPGNKIGGNLQITDGGAFSIESTEVGGNLEVQNISVTSAQSEICGTDVNGNLQFANNRTPVAIGTASASCLGNSIGGNLQVTNNSAAVQVFDDAVEDNLQCQNNSSVTGSGDTAR